METLAMLFMVEIPEGANLPKTKEDLLLYLSRRYERTIVEAIQQKEKPAYLINDILNLSLERVIPSDSPKDMAQEILNSDQYLMWEARFLDGDNESQEEETDLQQGNGNILH